MSQERSLEVRVFQWERFSHVLIRRYRLWGPIVDVWDFWDHFEDFRWFVFVRRLMELLLLFELVETQVVLYLIRPSLLTRDAEFHMIPTSNYDTKGTTDRSVCLSKTGNCSSRNLAKLMIAERTFLTRRASGLIKSRMEKSGIPTCVIRRTLQINIAWQALTVVYETSLIQLSLDKYPNQSEPF